MKDHITTLMLLIISLTQIGLIIVCVYYFKIFTARVFNNTEYEMTNILYEELHELGNETQEEKALWSYFREKLNDVYIKYKELRDRGIGTLKDEKFVADLMGSTEIDMKRHYPFNDKLISQITRINEKNFAQFSDYMYADIATSRKRKNFLIILKRNTLHSFRQNVKTIYQIWQKSKKETKVINEVTETDLFIFESSVSINRKKLKEVVATGESGILKVLRILQNYCKDEEKRNVIIMLISRYNDYKKKDFFNIADNKEVNKLRNSILELIDTI